MRLLLFVQILVLALAGLPGATAETFTVTWSFNLGGDVANNGLLSATTDDQVNLQWAGGHNLYRADGACSQYPTLSAYQQGQGYQAIEAGWPGQNPYQLPMPSVSSATEYCYVCISHYSTMRFTLQVSPPAGSIVCIDENAGVLTPSGFVPLARVTKGTQVVTPAGRLATVRRVVTQASNDRPWEIAAGVCHATAPTVVSPAHAIWCDGKWAAAEEVARRSDSRRLVRYVNLQTDDYCADKLVLDSGLIVETWDGRARDAFRPHSYEDGVRVNCTTLAPAEQA